MWAGNFTLSLRQPTARPKGVLRGGGGSPDHRRPLRPLEGHTRELQKDRLFLTRIS